ncbi:MAG: CpsD/CapB family tyrosine-protein kinase [Candidatus Omnitrophota bacterium]
MGKITDALQKVMKEREVQKMEVRDPSVVNIDRVVNTEDAKGPLPEAFVKNTEVKPKKKKFNLEERLRQRERMYLAVARDNSGIDPRIVTYHDYHSPMSEQYRILRTNIKSYLSKKEPLSKLKMTKSLVVTRVFTVSSSVRGEGKTITASNLAVSFAHDSETKVLLIDCDLRKGSVSELFALNGSVGISDYLARKVEYSRTIHPTKVKNLFIVPKGKINISPSEMFGSNDMRVFLEQIKSQSFNYIIIDTPPILPFTDAGVLGAQTEGVLLVVKAQKTQAQAVLKAKDFLNQAQAKLLGIVLAQVDYHLPDLYSDYYYYFKQKTEFNQSIT